ncbi:transcription termination factor NusA [candidate division WOR-1 bacterium RIFOXYB2_FULL_42_35]|uniref:Transcription termination/antitermination protein NusA n=1 Tax=candidate division WOR-1 bacterium RIFOXYC2_FULL_41_25 TaxID=1802586 RepID=A0A1F4TIH1_UNCSA|nr:MAG: transcription termination factor NusA [candidate division WOR-1 bacterium RIFOXYA2_FULL_41_14]OGC24063.1 MAG: transcription termination factor NusA [candidate division WOR-1 bacterium RIFOXYB2_FULL_42_35]OGC32486.1 MAG: transcription termination factor NusA [candidate division WOR-1 bacterium RIFOXYC2_FULL_41_25]OGC41427.1 MAG: transcription termination factor NusA [candidate division WOR-1 bacterium RIFOXYD2_FULL_41_8]
MKIDNFEAMLEEIGRDRGIKKEALLEAIKAAMLSAAKKHLKEPEEELEARLTSAGEAKIIHKVGDKEKDVTPKDFGRLAAQTAKQVIIQRIREAEKEKIFDEFNAKQGEIITGIVQRREYGGYLVNLGKIETVLAVSEQIPGETFSERERIKVYVVETRKTPKGPFVVISRAHSGLIKKLFEMEIPEIKEGILEIKAIAREPGKRTKIAIHSNDEKIGAVGTCVGHMGARIQNIVRELGQERIDIVEWQEQPEKFITKALSPAKVSKVELNKEEKSARVFLPEKDLSLAIGKEGQNVRLAVKITGWKIDIVSLEKADEIAAGKKTVKKLDRLEEAKQKIAKIEAAGAKEKIKVHEKAKEMGISSKELIEKLKGLGFEVKVATSVIPEEALDKLKE